MSHGQAMRSILGRSRVTQIVRPLESGGDVGVELRDARRDGDTPKRTPAFGRLPGGEGGEQRLAVGDGSRHRPRVVEARRERPAAVDRNEVERRLEAGDAAVGGGDADRAAGVAPERRVGETGCERGRRAAARAARDASGRDGIRDPAEVRIHRRDSVRELVQVRLADVRVARRLEAAYALRRRARHVIGEDRRAVGRRQPRGVEEILDGERNALARPVRPGEEDSFGWLGQRDG